MSPAVSVAKAKPTPCSPVDAGDIGTADGVVPVFSRLAKLAEPLSHTHYDLYALWIPARAPQQIPFSPEFPSDAKHAKFPRISLFNLQIRILDSFRISNILEIEIYMCISVQNCRGTFLYALKLNFDSTDPIIPVSLFETRRRLVISTLDFSFVTENRGLFRCTCVTSRIDTDTQFAAKDDWFPRYSALPSVFVSIRYEIYMIVVVSPFY